MYERFKQGEPCRGVIGHSSYLAVPLFFLRRPGLHGVLAAFRSAELPQDTFSSHQTYRTLQSSGEVVLSLLEYVAESEARSRDHLYRVPGMEGCVARSENDARVIASRVADIYGTKYRKRSGPRDQWDQVGRPLFEQKVARFVCRGEPVQFVLPAFPCKSRNQQRKVSGFLPDMGERLALETLVQLTRDVRQECNYPATMVVVSDGRVFADLVGVSDDRVSQYSARIREIGQPFCQEGLSFFSLEDAFAAPTTSHDDARDRLMTLYGASEDWVRQRLKRDEDFAAVFVGLLKFMLIDLEDTFPADLSKSKRRKACEAVARKMVSRNEAYSNLVEAVFPQAVRLSIHPHPNVKKFGINLVPCPDGSIWRTPWHSVAVKLKDSSWILLPKEDAEKRNCVRMVDEKDGLVYYEEKLV